MLSLVWLCVTPWIRHEPARLLCPRNFPGKNTDAGFHFSSPRSSRPRDQTYISCISCTGRRFFTSYKGPGSFSSVLWKHLVPLMCLVDLLSISVLKLVFNQAYPQKMLLPNPITSSSFDWFFCSWGLRTLGGGENSSWGYISSGPRGYCYSWVLSLTQCPQHCRVSLYW